MENHYFLSFITLSFDSTPIMLCNYEINNDKQCVTGNKVMLDTHILLIWHSATKSHESSSFSQLTQ